MISMFIKYRDFRIKPTTTAPCQRCSDNFQTLPKIPEEVLLIQRVAKCSGVKHHTLVLAQALIPEIAHILAR